MKKYSKENLAHFYQNELEMCFFLFENYYLTDR